MKRGDFNNTWWGKKERGPTYVYSLVLRGEDTNIHTASIRIHFFSPKRGKRKGKTEYRGGGKKEEAAAHG